jgi:hypothetical protein
MAGWEARKFRYVGLDCLGLTASGFFKTVNMMDADSLAAPGWKDGKIRNTQVVEKFPWDWSEARQHSDALGLWKTDFLPTKPQKGNGTRLSEVPFMFCYHFR